LSLQAQISGVRNLFNLQFTEPWLFDSRWQFSVTAFNFEYQFQDFTRNSTGGDMSFGYPISEALELDIPGELVARGKYKLEDVQVESGGRSEGSQQRPGSFFAGGITSSLGFELQYDTRNNKLFPTEGQLHTAKVEYANEDITFSETEFVKWDWESRLYVPIVWEFVLRLNAEVGYIAGLSAEEPVPLFERYFVGGPRTVRGFDRFTLGPARRVARGGGDPSSSLSDFNIGGNKQLLLTAEVEFPILTAAGLKGVVFADAGNAFDDGQPLTLAVDLFKDPENNYSDALRSAVGFGIRWRSPLGPLRFEWGFPLQRLRGEDAVVFDFSIGNAF
jgi:outer membrane protein insertion porin family